MVREGTGLIVGDYSPAEAEDLAAILRSPQLPVAPLLIRREAVPAAAEGR
jgi:preprotein translocase subunit SecD